MTQPKQITAGPQVQAITVQDGDMRVLVSEDVIEVSKIGPQGGVSKAPIKYTRDEMARLLRLLELAQQHQELFARNLAS